MNDRSSGGGRPGAPAAPAPASAGPLAALGGLREEHRRAVAWARVGVNAVVTAAYLRALVAGAGGWYVPATGVRALLVVAAAVLLGLARRSERPAGDGLDLGGVAIDAASLLVAGSRALTVAERSAVPLAVAEAALLAGILALAVAQVGAGHGVDRRARRADEDLRAREAEAAASLERSLRGLRDAQARAEGFAQLVIHDLRNPLAVVLANLRLAIEALGDGPDHAHEVESLRVAAGEAVRLSGMIGDLLLVPRLEGGDLAGQFSATAVRELLDAVATAAGTRARAKGIRLEVQGPPELVAWLDASLVRRMLDNLAANAIRHTPRDGRIELAARIERDRLRVAVRNTGEPVADPVRARLFQKYATLGGTDAQRSGLGLYLCRLVAEAHGGVIALVDRPGWNVSFEVELPLAPERQAVASRSARGGAPAEGGGVMAARSTQRSERSEEECTHA
jgi:signal transduction histidine kinase